MSLGLNLTKMTIDYQFGIRLSPNKMKITIVIYVCFCFLCLGSPTKPNIIFILADDLGWGDLRCYGNSQVKTPNLDKLAQQGKMFTDFYVNGSVCSPSRASFMTGQYPAALGIHGHIADHDRNQLRCMPDWLDPKIPNVTQFFKDNGYVTAHFGKWHLGSLDGAPSPSSYGIDDHRTFSSTGPTWEGRKYIRADSTTLMVNEAVRFMKSSKGQPFYMNIWTLLTHSTLDPRPEKLKQWMKLSAPGRHVGARSIYYASLQNLDEQLGQLFEAVDDLGIADNTLIVFTSDNGPEDIHIRTAAHSGVGSAGPFRGRKRSIYEGGIRVPLIIKWPKKVKAGSVDTTSIVSAVDFLPTFCKLANISIPKGSRLDGEDVSDIFLGDSRKRSNPLFWNWRDGVIGIPFHKSPMLAVRDGKWKLLMNPDETRIELYNLVSSPMELDNLADQNPTIVKRLSKKLLDWNNSLPQGGVSVRAGKNQWAWPVAR